MNKEDLSELITFVERFDEKNTWNISNSNKFEQKFWKIKKNKILTNLEKLNISLVQEESLLTIDNTEKLRTEIQNYYKKEDKDIVYDYKTIAEGILEKSLSTILRLCPYMKEDYSKIHLTQSTPFKEEWSQQIDISFQAGSDNGNEIVYPNAMNFGEIQIQASQAITNRRYSHKREFFHYCYLDIPHELIHCVQSKRKQVDSDPYSWSAEHDASYLAFSILQSILYKEEDSQFEELIINLLDDLKYFDEVHEMLDGDYQKWRNSFGLFAPEKAHNVSSTASLFFKEKLSFESMVESDDDLKDQLDTIFKDRI
jgi:Txe/YoeB family toxin of Txe-Axe toxin-antitoxin module